MRTMILSAVATVACVFTGCAHTTKPAPAPEVSEPVAVPAPAAKPAEAPVTPAVDLLAEVDVVLRGATVYFDFDTDQLSQRSLDSLQRVAAVLRKQHAVSVKIEGNCDERGTEEYNLSLGQRRAAVARKYLADLGVDSSQLDTVSFGSMRPVDPGHSEQAWSQNRRDELRASR